MNVLMVVLRLIHVIAGIFWVGTVWYFTLFFLPRVKSFGQEQGRIMQTMSAQPFPTYMTTAAVSVALSGIIMYWYTSARLSAAWIFTVPGIVLTLAALLGIFAVVEGLVISRPTAERMAQLGRQAAAAGGPPAPAVMQEMQALAAKLEHGVYRTAGVVLLTVIGMATFRYF
jgi:uncharacterized membrane protein